MGACQSCCKAKDVARSNQSNRYANESNPSVFNPNAEVVIPLNRVSSHSNSNEQALTARNIIITDKKMFNPYNKLPPIKKHSNGDSKRTSFISREYSESKANALFDTYKDPKCDCILAEGVEKFCDDLEVRPDEFIVLVLAWKLNAETMCVFTREQFISGCQSMRVDSIKGIQAKFSDLIAEIQNKQSFKEMYKWTYRFGLEQEAGQRTLPVEMAISLWKLVFSQQEPAILPRWLNFLQKHQNIRGVSRDTWDMFLNFVEQVSDDLSSYDDTEAWPSLLDDFVEYDNDCQNQNVETDLHFTQ
ncbi:DCN1-like protein 3 [Mya arenaria]|uniref:DCN1-like protein 3 n=1 Tax=Mya arenaria TaxID=6604 RepID=UPI0022E4DB48|nr:DCN1-like protein 3 [Mya arenaria]